MAFLEQSVAYFRARGIRVRRVLTDNGSAYVSRAFAAAGDRPRTNGKAERFIQTALREWAYAATYQTCAQRTAALAVWLHHCNWHRPHTAPAGQPAVARRYLSRTTY